MEQRFRLGHISDLPGSLIKLIEDRYEVSPGNIAGSINPLTHPAFQGVKVKSIMETLGNKCPWNQKLVTTLDGEPFC